jgi:hypothetical protein
MSHKATAHLLVLHSITNENPLYWSGHHYQNKTLEDVRDIYLDWQYTLNPATMNGVFEDMGADAQPEDSFKRAWRGDSNDYGYIGLLKKPRDEARALVEFGLLDASSQEVDHSEYNWVVYYPVNSNGGHDDSRENHFYSGKSRQSVNYKYLAELTFLQAFIIASSLKMNIYLNDDREKISIPY